MRELRILSPQAILGYGYPLASLEAGLRADPHLIGVDGGSVDAGPYYLGEGTSFTSRAAVKRDLRPLLAAGQERRIPVVIGSAGGAGGRPHVEWCFDIVAEIAREEGWNLRIAVIHAEQDKARLTDALRAGKIRPIGPAPDLSEADLRAAPRIVAQMGVEPFQEALGDRPDVVVAGRSCDVSIFAALPLLQGYDPGLAMHMSKIIECGAYCAEPGGASDGMLATLRDDHFLLRPLATDRRCTRLSVASHSLYEQSHPYLIYEPSGVVDVSTAEIEELPGGVVRVRNSSFRPAERPTVKIEGAVPVGYRAVTIAGIRDPIAIRALDDTIEAARSLVRQTLVDVAPDSYQIHFHVYGRDGVMQEREPRRRENLSEVGLVVEVVAPESEVASSICALVRSTALHYHYPGRMTTGGSLAFPFSPSDVAWGRVYEFRIYHLWEIDRSATLFPIEWRSVSPTLTSAGGA